MGDLHRHAVEDIARADAVTGIEMTGRGKLIFICGKMAAGKSTLARALAEREAAVLLELDHFLGLLFPGEIVDIPSFVKRSARIREALAPHICALLAMGVSVVPDFPGNTRNQRAWFRQLCLQAGAEHELHYIEVADEICRRQLRERSKGLPPGTRWTTEAEFDAMTAYFEPPAPDEQFNVIRHRRA